MRRTAGTGFSGNLALKHLKHSLDTHLRLALGYPPRPLDPRLSALESRVRAVVPKGWSVGVGGGLTGAEEYLRVSKQVKLPACGPGIGSMDTGTTGSLSFSLVLGKTLSTA